MHLEAQLGLKQGFRGDFHIHFKQPALLLVVDEHLHHGHLCIGKVTKAAVATAAVITALALVVAAPMLAGIAVAGVVAVAENSSELGIGKVRHGIRGSKTSGTPV